MKKNTIAVFLSALLFTAAVTPIQNSDLTAHARDSYNIDVSVNLNSCHKKISPYIYGVNSDFRTEEYLYNANATSARQGGNRFSGYNWETNYSNAGRDYLHYSDNYLVDFDSEALKIPGHPALGFAREAAEKNVPYKITTVQIAGYVAADSNGEITEDEIAPSPRWKQVKASKNGEFSLIPDTTDDYVYIDEYVNYLVENLGDSTTKAGYQAYNLDNEPSLWSSTHARMHPDKVTCEEIVNKSVDYASAIKKVDPKADIFGLALYGIGAYDSFNNAPDWEQHSDEYDWFISYYLDEMKKAEDKHGKRLIDVIDVHYYSEAKGQCRVTECTDYTHTDCIEARLQAPRTLYDNTYMETSWITGSFPEHLPLLESINESIDSYYPGTKLALTEYNFGGGDHISGGIAVADALGAFASNDVFVSNLWKINDTIEYQTSAINLYTNYDGKGSAFGDTLVESSTSDIEKAVSYAAIEGTDQSKLTLVLTNKSLDMEQNTSISLDADVNYTSAKVYGITEDSPEIRLLQTVDAIENNSFNVTLPPLCAVQIEINAENSVMPGDVNSDKSVDSNDIKALNNYLTAKSQSVISADNADILNDNTLNVFDIIKLKRRIITWNTPVVKEKLVPFEPTKTGQWRIRDGMGDKTLQCVFTGNPGHNLRLAFGYWDPNYVDTETGKTGKWFNDDSTFLGTYTFDETGRATVPISVPTDAKSVEIILFNYYTTDESGNSVQLDKAEVGLEKIIEINE